MRKCFTAAALVLGLTGCSQLPNPDLSNANPQETYNSLTANCREADKPAECYLRRQSILMGQRSLAF